MLECALGHDDRIGGSRRAYDCRGLQLRRQLALVVAQLAVMLMRPRVLVPEQLQLGGDRLRAQLIHVNRGIRRSVDLGTGFEK
ncbi:MAG TPA: hypothetical protein PJ994_13465 [Tepidiformaceae bacterium]|nr:hypothetical protein [Tepidiformaceae bacterium]